MTVSRSMLLLAAAIFALPLAEQASFAQAPTGPQGGAPPPQQQQQNPQAPQAPKPAQEPPQAGVSITVDVPVVTLDVVATTQHGDLIPNLKKENFRVFDEGVPQAITNFSPTEAPITMVLLLEFSARGYYDFYAYIGKYWASALFPQLQQKDWVALETFDMKTRIEADFTQNKEEVMQALNHLYFPGFSESNVFDALLETTDRLKDVKGKKSIVLVGSGVDTFSKHTLDQTMKALRGSDVTIFCVGLGQAYANFAHAGMQGMTLLQAENQLKTFARETGGFAWFPQFDGEMPDVFRSVAAFLRHQYSLSFSPSSGAKDGKFHKVKIELVAPDGSPLTVVDQKGKKQKYQVYAREGYQATKVGVGD
ncbi:MAG TPA: VWA domain-containing protein [Methylomirabilota bacterium]|nr:VWA domain-containing protein [Methylomirabilota bacterium]